MAYPTPSTEPTSGVQLEPHHIILRPLITEKGLHRSTRDNAYAFEVNRAATKIEIRDAVQKLFNVTVTDVRTQNRKGKPRRTKFRIGHTSDWKKAIVSVDSEQKIDFY